MNEEGCISSEFNQQLQDYFIWTDQKETSV